MGGSIAIKSTGALLAAMALGIAPAQAACWNAEETEAATVRELQSALMVSALRCQVMKMDISSDYNAFLRTNKATIQRMNDRLKAHFINAAGPVGGQTAYDSFTTSLANGHGSEMTNSETCQNMASLAREAGLMAGSSEGLTLLAARQGLVVRVPEGACPLPATTIALAAPIVAASTPIAATASVEHVTLVAGR